MIKTIISVFTIYGISANRLLLQQVPPEFVPIVVEPPIQLPAVPVVEPEPPVAPAVPALPVEPPVAPVVPPAVPVAPVWTPPVPPPVPVPVVPVWTPPPLPPATAFNIHTTMECTLPNTARAGCAGRITEFTNAAQNFQMKCSNIGACAASTLNFNYVNSFTERIESIAFSEMYSGFGATVNMDSTDSTMKQYIDKFECKAPGACLDTTLNLIGGASVNDVNCVRPEYCQNCQINVCERNPIPGLPLLCGTPKPCFFY